MTFTNSHTALLYRALLYQYDIPLTCKRQFGSVSWQRWRGDTRSQESNHCPYDKWASRSTVRWVADKKNCLAGPTGACQMTVLKVAQHYYLFHLHANNDGMVSNTHQQIHTHTLDSILCSKWMFVYSWEKDLLCSTAPVAGFQYSEVDKWSAPLAWPAIWPLAVYERKRWRDGERERERERHERSEEVRSNRGVEDEQGNAQRMICNMTTFY